LVQYLNITGSGFDNRFIFLIKGNKMYILKLFKKFNDYFSNEWEKEVEPVLHTYKIYNVNPKSKKIKKPKSKNTNN